MFWSCCRLIADFLLKMYVSRNTRGWKIVRKFISYNQLTEIGYRLIANRTILIERDDGEKSVEVVWEWQVFEEHSNHSQDFILSLLATLTRVAVGFNKNYLTLGFCSYYFLVLPSWVYHRQKKKSGKYFALWYFMVSVLEILVSIDRGWLLAVSITLIKVKKSLFNIKEEI